MASPDFTGVPFCKGHTGPAETLTPGPTPSWEGSHSHSRRGSRTLRPGRSAEKRAYLTASDSGPGGPGSQAQDGSEASSKKRALG